MIGELLCWLGIVLYQTGAVRDAITSARVPARVLGLAPAGNTT
jgi:hypothetical protein